MNKILQLRPTEFTWIEQEQQDVGFIAQEVEEIIPEVINTTRGMMEEGKGNGRNENNFISKVCSLFGRYNTTIEQTNRRIRKEG